MKKAWGGLVTLLTGEWILDRFAPGANGSGVIFARALWTALLGYAVLIPVLYNLHAQPIRQLLAEKLPGLGAIFAGAFASLHTRYSSQWKYLAGVYNQIKAAEARGDANLDRIASWKLGYIADADVLHLSRKPLFASIIASWGHEEAVRRELERHYGDAGRAQLLLVIVAATRVYEDQFGTLPNGKNPDA